MAEVNNLFSASLVQNIMEIGWHIILTHFVECEVPELFVISIVLNVLVGEAGSSAVSDPHIITSIY
jgi:hypothetical protein